MIATEPEQKRPGLQVGELPFMDPRGSVLSLTGPLAIGDPRVICRPLARLCEKAAKLQRLDLDKLKYDGIYALLGISEDGSVMALSWRDDAWLPTRAPVPSSVARAKELGLVKLGAQVPLQPVWARVNSQKLTVFRNGVEVEIWRTPTLARPVIKAEAAAPEIARGKPIAGLEFAEPEPPSDTDFPGPGPFEAPGMA
jgi:hypothetical protein